MNKLFIQLLQKRHQGPSFLQPKYEESANPFMLADMEKATAYLKKSIKKQQKILIYGDYDVDGVTASTLMTETLRLAGLRSENVKIMLPDRFADGYGMSPKLVKYAKKNDISLVITVDCGSRNHAIIDELNTLNIATIITDHHETDEKMPEAVAVINPHRKDKPTKELQNLAGVGVAFKIAQALVEEGLIKKGQEKWLLDLVLIGTICDNMTLVGENRILGYYGMKVLAKTRRPGLKELMRTAGIKRLSSESVGFQLGPRLNAAGRLDTADIALNLLCAKSASEAAAYANQLEVLNKKRKHEQNLAINEIIKRGIDENPVIIETGDWHEGILGIVAGRLVEEYHRPAFVLTNTSDNIYKGSGRSFGDFNLAEALNFANDSIISGGGHAAAAGVKIEQKNLYAFREKINEYYKSLKLTNQEYFLKTNPDLELNNLTDLSLDLLDDLKSLEPYGAGNEEPVFLLNNLEIIEKRKIGDDGQHLRLDVRDQNNKTMKLVAFYAPKTWFSIEPGETPSILIKILENEWNGTRSVEGRILDIVL